MFPDHLTESLLRRVLVAEVGSIWLECLLLKLSISRHCRLQPGLLTCVRQMSPILLVVARSRSTRKHSDA